jgi:hypothetical protein
MIDKDILALEGHGLSQGELGKFLFHTSCIFDVSL